MKVIYFDGDCGLCNKWVDFVLTADRKKLWRFATLQDQRMEMNSIVVRDGDETLEASAAVLRILQTLGFPYSLAVVFRIVPTAIRDAVYLWIARHRYRWFGKRDTCRMPTPEERGRFL